MNKRMNENQYDIQQQTTTSEIQNPDLGHALTDCDRDNYVGVLITLSLT